MSQLDWGILIATLAAIVGYGVWKTRSTTDMHSYLKGDKNTKWWTVGLSVMATQASAITFLSTPGQAYYSGMGFVQFYFGLPIAMVIICYTFIPIYHKLKVYTAYEYLETRFDVKTRTLTAILFLVQRGLAAGITIYAPAIILSTILGWNLNYLNIIIGTLVIIYTVSGGTKAVNVTQKQQMFVIMLGMFVAFFIILSMLPEGVGFMDSLSVAGAADKMNVIDFSWDPNNRYTVWTGVIGGTFLALSYFGTDQSQVQRYLSADDMEQSRRGLIMNGLLKIPMQFFILLVGVMVFVFFQYNKSPLFFNPQGEAILQTEYAAEYQELEQNYENIFNLKREALLDNNTDALASLLDEERHIREEAKAIIKKGLPTVESNDKDYVFISFILNYLPKGLVGLLLAMIFSAAMSSTASELNALGTTSMIDIYKRSIKRDEDDQHYLKASKWLTFLWGIIAICFACYGTLFENLIQLVNIIGSLFYGTILGIFVVGFYMKFIKSRAVFIGAIISEAIVMGIYFFGDIGYLWLNLIGCLLVIAISFILQSIWPASDGNSQLLDQNS